MADRLGIVQMANKPLCQPGHLGNPASFGYPVVYRTARSAYTRAILARDEAVMRDYLDEGRAVEATGAGAVMTTCGFNIVYQDRLSAALAVPVATSSLLLLPTILRIVAPDRAVGLVTYDRAHLTDAMLALAGVGAADRGRIRLAGLDGTESWHQLARDEPNLPLETIRADLFAQVESLLSGGQRLGALLLECSALCPFGPSLRAAFGLPVFDFLSLANFVQAAVSERNPFDAAR